MVRWLQKHTALVEDTSSASRIHVGLLKILYYSSSSGLLMPLASSGTGNHVYLQNYLYDPHQQKVYLLKLQMISVYSEWTMFNLMSSISPLQFSLSDTA